MLPRPAHSKQEAAALATALLCMGLGEVLLRVQGYDDGALWGNMLVRCLQEEAAPAYALVYAGLDELPS